jgi:hypothetical protein
MSLTSDVIDSVAGALAVAALGATGVQGRRLVARARSRRQDDHQPINYGCWGVHMPPDGGRDGVRVLVICAPSRTISEARFDPAAAVRFVKSHFAQEFPGPPAHSSSEGVRFDRTADPGSDYVWINASGRVDLSLTVPTKEIEAGRQTLDVCELLQPIARLAAAVRDPAYWRIFGCEKPPRHSRFDWRIGPSIDNRDRDMNNRIAWDDLSFPGRAPASRSAGQRPFCPIFGFAQDKLTSRGTDEPVEELLRTFLRSFLTDHGYLGVDDAVDDVAKSWQR